MAMQAAARPVHPHMRGVYEGFKLDDTPHYGSSPRAWGLRRDGGDQVRFGRSIPTYVGFTVLASWYCCRYSVHPHIRGVYPHEASEMDFASGPSPHTWGLRLLPAHDLHVFLVHPHIRGVYPMTTRAVGCRGGPSPHTWGLQPFYRGHISHVRSIPTYVGFTTGLGHG